MPGRLRTQPRCYPCLVTFLIAGIATAILGMLYTRILYARTASRIIAPLATTMMVSSKPVIVVGSGLAGLSASYEALKAGVSVHMIERAPKPGGNSIKASSGINGAGTKWQKEFGIAEDDSFYGDTVHSAGDLFTSGPKGIDRTALVTKLTTHSKDAVEWLTDEIGVELSVVAQLGGHSVARTHRGAGKLPPGAAIVKGLLAKLNAHENFTLSTSTTVNSLLIEDGHVHGVSYTSADGQDHELRGPVVFAAGGFAGDAHGLLAKYRPDLKGMPSTNDERPAPHTLLSPLGVHFIDMQSVQVHPTGFVDPKDPSAAYKFLAAEALRGEGGILLDNKGERFVNELQTRDVVTAAVTALPEDDAGSTRQWDVTLLLDPAACEAAAGHVEFYTWKGLMKREKIKDLPEAVIASVDKYASAVASGAKDPLGRPTYGRWKLPAGEANRDQEVCVGRVTPVVHFTMGGVTFNTDAQVLAGQDNSVLEPVRGLWAAGEITGGIHGANRLGGSSLLECVVFGRVAGVEAANSLKLAN